MEKVYIIGEVGPNHNGDVNIALKMIEEMATAGVDSVKFQMTNPYNLYSLDSFKASYQKMNDNAKSPIEMSLKYQLPKEAHFELCKRCKELGVDYICSAFDIDSLKFIDENLDFPYFKVASGEIFSVDMMDYIAKSDKPVILSTGMATYEEVEIALELLNKYKKKEIIILHCISNYPAAYEEVNLNNMLELVNRFSCKVGFSDHTVGNECSIAAVAMGASVVEKHVTLDKNANGPDHKASIDIQELKQLVSSIRHIECAIGVRERQFSDSQREISRVARKSVVTKNDLIAGHIIQEKDICYKRPGIGFMPIDVSKVIGHRLLLDKQADKVILPSEID